MAGGRFLIAGIDVFRGGLAIPENAISFRAYHDAGSRFVFVGAIDGPRSSDPENYYLCDLSTSILTPAPAGELWFLAAADVPPLSPTLVALSLFAFDGREFRRIWSHPDVPAESFHSAVEIRPDGFVILSLIDEDGGFSRSPTVVLHEQYVLNADGPAKVSEWRSDRF